MIVDAHLDIACAMLEHGRDDFSVEAHEWRRREGRSGTDENQCMLSLPGLLDGQVRLVFATTFVAPCAASHVPRLPTEYRTPAEAATQTLKQLALYDTLCARHRELVLVGDRAALDRVLAAEQAAVGSIGLVLLMEGATAIQHPAQMDQWYDRGIRLVTLTWNNANRYAGGCSEPGPLTEDGRRLLAEMERLGVMLDLSHCSELAFWQALDHFQGTVVATHSNCRELVPGERMLGDRQLQALLERNGVIGVNFYNAFIVAGWDRSQGKVPTEALLRHVDHICQRAGNAWQVGIGSDCDGGFGAEGTPTDFDTIADLPRLADCLSAHGYADADTEAIMGHNWIRLLRTAWAAEPGR